MRHRNGVVWLWQVGACVPLQPPGDTVREAGWGMQGGMEKAWWGAWKWGAVPLGASAPLQPPGGEIRSETNKQTLGEVVGGGRHQHQI